MLFRDNAEGLHGWVGRVGQHHSRLQTGSQIVDDRIIQSLTGYDCRDARRSEARRRGNATTGDGLAQGLVITLIL